jgi:hypothetical protein
MIFDMLFNQYKRGKSILFGSVWLNIHGRLLIGNPRDNELDSVHPELQRTYYHLKEDRFSHPVDRLEYRQQSMLLTTNREAERKRIAKAVSVLSMTAVFAVAGAAGVKSIGDGVASKVKGATSGFSLPSFGAEASCVAMVEDYTKNELPESSRAKWSACVRDHKDAMDEELRRLKGGEE